MSYDNLSPHRLIGETKEEYNKRRKVVNRILKMYSQGRRVADNERSKDRKHSKAEAEESNQIQSAANSRTEVSEGNNPTK